MNIVGLDLGERQDYTALAVCRPRGLRKEINGGKRYPLGTDYPLIVADVTNICNNKLTGEVILAIDATGVGLPVVQMFQNAPMRPGIKIIPVLITSQFSWSLVDGIVHVSKRELVYNLQLAFANGMIDIAQIIDKATNEDLSAIVKDEASALQPKITKRNDITVTHRDGTHDDFILAVAMAVFVADVCYPSGYQDYTNPMGDETNDTITTGSQYKWNI